MRPSRGLIGRSTRRIARLEAAGPCSRGAPQQPTGCCHAGAASRRSRKGRYLQPADPPPPALSRTGRNSRYLSCVLAGRCWCAAVIAVDATAPVQPRWQRLPTRRAQFTALSRRSHGQAGGTSPGPSCMPAHIRPHARGAAWQLRSHAHDRHVLYIQYETHLSSCLGRWTPLDRFAPARPPSTAVGWGVINVSPPPYNVNWGVL